MTQDEASASVIPLGGSARFSGLVGRGNGVRRCRATTSSAQQETVRQRVAKAAAQKVVAHPSVEERQTKGAVSLGPRPRTSELAVWEPPADRADPVALLVGQETSRVQELVPVRHARMATSAFAFYRGAALLMAADLAAHAPQRAARAAVRRRAPVQLRSVRGSGPLGRLRRQRLRRDQPRPVRVGRQAPGDVVRPGRAGQRAGQEGRPGRGRGGGRLVPRVDGRLRREGRAGDLVRPDRRRAAGRRASGSCPATRASAGPRRRRRRRRPSQGAAAKARLRDAWSAIEKITEVVDGRRRFRDQPPLLVRLDLNADLAAVINALFREYRATLQDDRQELLKRYEIVDMGHKVVGVGSVGLLAFVLLLRGRDEQDLMVLQAKQAQASVLEAFTRKSAFTKHGHRVVTGQRLMQAASDSFLGWIDGPAGRSFYVRQLRDMKWSPDPASLTERAAAPVRAAVRPHPGPRPRPVRGRHRDLAPTWGPASRSTRRSGRSPSPTPTSRRRTSPSSPRPSPTGGSAPTRTPPAPRAAGRPNSSPPRPAKAKPAPKRTAAAT